MGEPKLQLGFWVFFTNLGISEVVELVLNNSRRQEKTTNVYLKSFGSRGQRR